MDFPTDQQGKLAPTKRCSYYKCGNNNRNSDVLFFAIPRACYRVKNQHINVSSGNSSRHINTCSFCKNRQQWLTLCKINKKSLGDVYQRYICSKHFADGIPSELHPEPLPVNEINKSSKRIGHIKKLYSQQTVSDRSHCRQLTPVENITEQVKNPEKRKISIVDYPGIINTSKKSKHPFDKILDKLLSETSSLLNEAVKTVTYETQKCDTIVKIGKQKVKTIEGSAKNENEEIVDEISKLQKCIKAMCDYLVNSFIITEKDKMKYIDANLTAEAVHLRKENAILRDKILLLNKKLFGYEEKLFFEDIRPLEIKAQTSFQDIPFIYNPSDTPTILLVTNDDHDDNS